MIKVIGSQPISGRGTSNKKGLASMMQALSISYKSN